MIGSIMLRLTEERAALSIKLNREAIQLELMLF